jgi:thymidylate synthase (FAD)
VNIIEQSFEIIYPNTKEDWLREAKRIERMGRICYKSEDKITDESYKNFIKSIMKKNHLSVIEHGYFSCIIITNRAIANELVRHRLCAFSQESTRYINYNNKFNNEITVIQPDFDSDELANFNNAMKNAQDAYFNAIQNYPPQFARDYLPLALKTEIGMTCNFRELLHIFKMRCSEAAHPQIRALFLEIQDVCKDNLPEIFELN